jgi:hypothetical protein
MREKPKGDRRLRRRGAAVALCSTLVLGGVLMAAPAYASSPSDGDETVSVPLAAPVSAATAVASAGTLAAIDLDGGETAVYPVKDGYHDTVRFAIHPLNVTGTAVPVHGAAVLTRQGKTVERWRLDGTKSLITWNGRVGTAIKAGTYRLSVTAWSPDNSRKTAFTNVRVVAKHLVKRTVVVRSKVGASSVTASMPKRLLNAYTMGKVTLRIRTVATVSGPASLVFTNGSVTRSVPLHDGTYTTPTLSIPQGFERVTIRHGWAPGTAHLKSVVAIWSYNALV